MNEPLPRQAAGKQKSRQSGRGPGLAGWLFLLTLILGVGWWMGRQFGKSTTAQRPGEPPAETRETQPAVESESGRLEHQPGSPLTVDLGGGVQLDLV